MATSRQFAGQDEAAFPSDSSRPMQLAGPAEAAWC